MTTWVALLIGAATVFCVIVFVQYRAKAAVHRPLSQRQPSRRPTQDVPLGMEATDLQAVARSARQNETLERSNTGLTRILPGSWGASDPTDITPMPDDATYAARYHAAFHTDTAKDS